MNKEQLLEELSVKIQAGEISREEVLGSFGALEPVSEGGNEKRVSQSLYAIGAAVAVIGILLFASQIWSDIGSFVRVMITLGIGLLITLMGSVFLRQRPKEKIGAIFHLIGGILIPGGVVVLLNELDLLNNSDWPIVFAFAIVTVFYIFLTIVHKHPILTFFVIASGTALVYLFARAALNSHYLYSFNDFYAYLTMAVGVSYLLLSYAFRAGWNQELIRALNFFGTLWFFSAAISMTWDSLFWQCLYTVFIFGGLALSIHLKSRIVLLFSTLFLVPHIINITREYFADSLGWPFSLVILGFAFVGLGYASVSINKRYLKKS